MQPQAASAGRPHRAGAVAAQAGKLLPVLAAVRGAEQRRVFHARVNGLRIGERGLDMPYALELPGMCVSSYHWCVVNGLPVSGDVSYANLFGSALGGPGGGMASFGSPG